MDTIPTAGDNHLTLDDLCERAGVTVRTVRYYISEGLLPPPAGGGPAARYGQDHLDRLAVIAMLKDRYLPLREIRRTLDGMPPAELASLARRATLPDRPEPGEARHHTRQPAAAPARHVHEPASADDYIASVLGQPSRTRMPPRASPDAAERSWKRIAITGEAELLIDEEVWRRRREQIDSLVTWARRILNGS